MAYEESRPAQHGVRSETASSHEASGAANSPARLSVPRPRLSVPHL